MRLLVTGASGFLGSHLVRQFVRDGHQVVVLKRTGSDLGRLDDCLARLTLAEIGADLAPLFAAAPVDAVIHLATCYGRNGETAPTMAETNTGFPLRLLEAACAAKVPLFINTDTGLDKELNLYSMSKRHFAEWGQFMARQGRIKFVNILLEHMYGPGDDASKFTTHVVRTLLSGAPELRLTAGEQLRDFIYIDDVVAAYALLLARAGEDPRRYVECGLGSAEPVLIRELVTLARTLTGAHTALNFGVLPYRLGEVMHSSADIGYLAGLGWRARTTLVDGLTKLISSERTT